MSALSPVLGSIGTTFELPKTKKEIEIEKLPKFIELIKNKLDPDKDASMIEELENAFNDERWEVFKENFLREYDSNFEDIEQIIIIVLSRIDNFDEKDLTIDLDFFKKLPEYVKIRKEWLATVCVDVKKLDNDKGTDIWKKAEETGCKSLIKSFEFEKENGFSVKLKT